MQHINSIEKESVNMKRRISTYFSLLVIVTSILVAPLHAIAEMSMKPKLHKPQVRRVM